MIDKVEIGDTLVVSGGYGRARRIIWWLLSRLFPFHQPHPGWRNLLRNVRDE